MFNLKSNYIKTAILILGSIIYSQEVSLSFGAVDETAGTMEILMENSEDVGGFQFDLTGLTITGASGGSAASAGFMLSNSSNRVIGFSLTGSVIPAGSGVLTVLTFEDFDTYSCLEAGVFSDSDGVALGVEYGDCYGDAPISGCMDENACNYDMDATQDDGSCEYPEGVCDCDGNPSDDYCDCEGNIDIGCGCGETNFECWDGVVVCDEAECSEEPAAVVLSFGNVDEDNGTMEILMENIYDVAGFQFDIMGITITGGSGGSAEEAGFMVSTSSNRVIGFSLAGSVISAGSGVLTNLTFSDLGTYSCLEAGVFSDADGNALDVEYGDCIGTPPVYGCTDESACNYDASADTDDGSCEYPEGVCDCDGNPTDDYCDCDGNVDIGCGCGEVQVECWDGTLACDDLECPTASVEILYNTPNTIGGFQFDMDGVTIVSAAGGAAEAAGFLVSAGSTTVIGFSLEGTVIEPGSGVLTVLEVQGDPADACLVSGDTELVIADPDGVQMYSWVDDCLTINCNLPDAPPAPEDLTATVSNDGAGNDVSLSWSASNSAEGYKVYQDGSLIGSTSNTSFSADDLAYSTTFDFCVSAYNIGGDSDQACTQATTGEAPPEPLIEPENLTAEAGDSVVLLNWDDPPGEVAGTLTVNVTTDQYAAETTWELVSSSGEVIASNPALANETEYSTDVELEAGSYTWTIFDSWGDGICCGYGYGGYQLLLDGTEIANGGEFGAEESVQFSVDGMVMSISTGYYVEPHGYEKGQIVENWQDLEVEYTIEEFVNVDRDLLGYNVWRSLVSGSGYEMVGSTDLNTQSYLDEGLENETTYYYVVTAVYDGGESDPSNEASATPMPYVPDPASNLVAEPGDGQVDLSWNAPGGFGGFPPCPDGSAEYVDCAGTCFNNLDCADGTYDGCVEGNNTWLGDGFCDDGSFNLVFWLPDNECPEYGNDCGDCGAFDPVVDDPNGVCGGDGGGGDTDCTSIDNFNVTSPDDCLENTNYFAMSWDGGCEITTLSFGVYDVSENVLDASGLGFDATVNLYGFGPNETYMFQVCSGDVCSDIANATSSSTDCGGGDEGDYGFVATDQMPPELIKNFNPDPANYVQTREELTGFDVQRSDVSGGPYTSIATTAPDMTDYVDEDVVNGNTYHYVVTAVYDIGTSDPSNEASATPMSTVVLSLSDAAVVSGDNVTITVSADNVEPISSLQLDLSDVPGFLTVVGIAASDRIPADWTLDASENNGLSVISGSSADGTQIEAGSGALFDIEFSTQADYPAEVSLCSTAESFTDSADQEYFVDSACSMVDVTIGYNVSLGMNVTTETADVFEDVIVELSIDTDTPVSSIAVQLLDSPDAAGFVAMDAGDVLPDSWDCNATLSGQVTCSGPDAFTGSGVFATAYGLVNETAFAGMVEFSYGGSNIVDPDGNGLYVASFESDSFEVYPGFLLAPMNLVAESGQNGEVPLMWQGMPDPVWVGYDSGGNYTSIGTGGAADFDVAIKFEQDQLSEYPGMNISKVRFIPNEASCEYSVRVWYGETLVVDQPVPEVILADWNEVTLTESVPLPSEGDLYIGYRSNTTTGFPAGCDGGPAVEGYGDLISLDGGGWTSISQSYGLNYNWNLNAYLSSPFGDVAELNPIESTPSNAGGMILESGVINTNDTDHNMSLISDDETDYNVWTDNVDRDIELTGYNVYRSDVSGSGYAMIGQTDGSVTEYLDTEAMNGNMYYYVVSSVYDNQHESDYSNEANAMPMSWLELGLTGGEVQGGDEITLTFSMTNDEPVAGVQFDLVDIPDYLYFTGIVGTDRVPADWSLSGAEQGAGNSRVIGFSLMGTTIEAGSGPLLEITLGSIASMPTDVEVCTGNESFADSEGNPFPSESVCSTVSIDVESVNTSISAVSDPVDQGDTFEVTVSMDSPVDIYGFQLEIDDTPESITAIDVQPSALLNEAGGMFQWSELDGYVNALWFTLDLSALEVSGDLFTITYQVDADAPDGISDICFRPTSVFSDENGIEIYTQYECSSVTVGVPDVMLSLEQTSATTYDIHMDNSGLVAGIQFTISDNPEMLSYVNFDATDRIPGDWMVQGSDVNGAATMVGFSLAGSTISAGAGSIGTVTVDHSMMDGVVDLCFDSFVISDPTATPWYTSAQCAEFVMPYGPSEVTQEITIDAYAFNMVSFNVMPEDLSIEGIMGSAGVLLAKDDDGAFYAPDFNVNQIGDINLSEGYKVFINGGVDQMVSVTGAPVDAMETLLIEAYKLNSLPYLPQVQMAASDVFGDYNDDILLVANDSGDFYVPAFNVFSLDMLYPGEAYSVFLNGANDVSFNYPAAGLARSEGDQATIDYYNSCISDHYKPVKTGLSSPIILTDLNGYINEGDEIAAYANGVLVGAVKIVDLDKPAVITAWEGYEGNSINLPGYMVGDEIELRVWNQDAGIELRVESNLTEDSYGDSPLVSGGITVYNMPAVPDNYTLNQNYPNPFNPSTVIEFSVPQDQDITINIYDIQGRLINTLFDGMIESGYHNVLWNGTDHYGQTVSAGLYLYTLQGEDIGLTRKMVFMK